MTAETSFGVVVIGRNEAPRLAACLASLPHGVPLRYVDSGSHDGSSDLARACGVPVTQLSADQPFTAARARNEGFAAITADWPDLNAVFFIDGDCALAPDFLPLALKVLQSQPELAVVVGRVEETNRAANVYGLLAALEWTNPKAGEILDFGELGGIMLVRASDFRAAGGFDASFIAGEDSEFGVRLRLAGRKSWRISQVMAYHAMEMQRFGQWWRRSVRAGHALAHRYAKHGRSPLADCRSSVFSTLVYGIGLPGLMIVVVALAGPWGAFPLLGYGYLWTRFFAHYRRKQAQAVPAAIAAGFGVLAKLANAQGLVRYHVQNLRGGFRLIEYK